MPKATPVKKKTGKATPVKKKTGKATPVKKKRGKHALPKKSLELKKAPKPVQGRPEVYNPLHNERVFRLAFLGCTDLQMAESFQIDEETFNAWKRSYPRFSESIQRGKADPNSAVEAALFHRATGFIDIDGKQYPPDTAAAFIWLKNRKPKEWRDKQEIGFTDEDGNDREVTIFQLPDNGRNSNIETKAE